MKGMLKTQSLRILLAMCALATYALVLEAGRRW